MACEAYKLLAMFDFDSMKKDTKKEKPRKRSRSRSPQQNIDSEKVEYVNDDFPNHQFFDFYCTLCDSHMNSDEMWKKHIEGKRHLKKLSQRSPVEQKYEYSNENPIIQKEFDSEFNLDFKKKDISKAEKTRKRSRSRSPQKNMESEKEMYVNYDIPNRQFGDSYCKIYDSQTKPNEMWAKPIEGKRHLKKLGQRDSTIGKIFKIPTIQKELDKVIGPIAGLDYICEILRNNQPAVYHCFLCSANLSSSELLIEHITDFKHQMAFLKEHDRKKYFLVASSTLEKAYLEQIVQDFILKYEQEHGRGKMSVKKEKKPESSSSNKKGCSDSGDKRPHFKHTRYSFPRSSSFFQLKDGKMKEQQVEPERSSERREWKWNEPEFTKYRGAQTHLHLQPQIQGCRSPTTKFSRYSQSKSTGIKEQQLEPECKDFIIGEKCRNRIYSEKVDSSDEEIGEKKQLKSTTYRKTVTHEEIPNSQSLFPKSSKYYRSKSSRMKKEQLQPKCKDFTISEESRNRICSDMPYYSDEEKLKEKQLKFRNHRYTAIRKKIPDSQYFSLKSSKHCKRKSARMKKEQLEHECKFTIGKKLINRIYSDKEYDSDKEKYKKKESKSTNHRKTATLEEILESRSPTPESSKCSKPKISKMKRRHLESECKYFRVHETFRGRSYSDRSFDSDKEKSEKEFKYSVYRKTQTCLESTYSRSPTPKPSIMKEHLSDSNCEIVLVRDTSKKRKYSYRSYYSEEEKYKKNIPESTIHKRRPPNLDIQDSSSEEDTYYRDDVTSPDEGKESFDLRELLQQKKKLRMWVRNEKAKNCRDLEIVFEKTKTKPRMSGNAEKINIEKSRFIPFSSENSNYHDKILLHRVDYMPPEEFLRLTLFKLDQIKAKEELEIKLLHRVAEKATALILKAEKEIPNVRVKSQEASAVYGTLPQNDGIVNTLSPSNLQLTEKENLANNKDREITEYAEFNSRFSRLLNSPKQYIDSRPRYHHQINNSPSSRNTPEREDADGL